MASKARRGSGTWPRRKQPMQCLCSQPITKHYRRTRARALCVYAHKHTLTVHFASERGEDLQNPSVHTFSKLLERIPQRFLSKLKYDIQKPV